jgi:NADH-quinone oxidoreductase subunit F
MEGLAIAAFAVGAEQAYVGIKDKYKLEISHLERAASEMAVAGILGEVPIAIVSGPDDYLLGEEKGLLEAIEGRDPLPRWYPPYVLGLHLETMSGVGAASIGPDDRVNPTVVNNVETLANVPHILRNGADWFRSIGTLDSPGTMVFTVSGDVQRETVAELAMGTPLSFLVYGIGEGPANGRRVKSVVPGASNAPIPDHLLDTPMDFASLRRIGSGLGSGGMIVYDDTACMVAIGEVLSRFLAVESCGQCPPCKLGTSALAERFARLESGHADINTVEEIEAWTVRVTDANRCGLGAGERALAAGILHGFLGEVLAHVGGRCPTPRPLRLPKMVDHAPEAGRFVYDEDYFQWRRP